MYINIWAVLLSAVAQFIVSAIWYMPIFGNLWGKIHNYAPVSEEEHKKAMKAMMPLLGVQFLTTLLTSFVFVLLLNGFPNSWSVYGLAFFFWLGFSLPVQISGVLFGGTEGKWVMKKILILVGGSLLNFMVLAMVVSLFR